MASRDWIECLDRAQASGLAGAILSFNTGDRVFDTRGAEATVSGLKYFLAAKYARAGYRVGYFSLASGLGELTPPGLPRASDSPLAQLQGMENPVHALRALEPILKSERSRCVLFVDYADHLASAAPNGVASNDHLAVLETLHAWSIDDDIRCSGNFIVLICRENALHNLLRFEAGFQAIFIGLPDLPTRTAVVKYLLSVREKGFEKQLGMLASGISAEEFGAVTGGLRLMDIENLLLEAAVTSKPVDREAVRARKQHAIGQLCHGLLEVIEPTEGFESVAGCRAAKTYFSALGPLWRRGHGSLPQGILLSGVPGSGKSFLIKALAKEFGTPCLVLRGIREPWVGQSERNLDLVLQVANDLAPCLLWTDEIDQQGMGERTAGPSGDSGVNQRMLARLLEFFGDSSVRGRILWIATTNRPDLLDMAIRDRFSVKMPFLHPTAAERADLLPMLAAQVGRALSGEVDCSAFGTRRELEMLSVRSLQEIVVWAGLVADMESGNPATEIAAKHLERALGDYRPGFDPVEQELIALISLQMTSFHSLLPWMDPEGFEGGGTRWPAYLDKIVDRDSGRLDATKLEQRIRELHAHRASRSLLQ